MNTTPWWTAARAVGSLVARLLTRTLGRFGCLLVLISLPSVFHWLDWLFTTSAGGITLAVITAVGVGFVVFMKRAASRENKLLAESAAQRRSMQTAAAPKREASAAAIAELLNKVLPGTQSTAFAGGRFGTTLFVNVAGEYRELPPEAVDYAKRAFRAAGFNRVVINDAHGRAKTMFT